MTMFLRACSFDVLTAGAGQPLLLNSQPHQEPFSVVLSGALCVSLDLCVFLCVSDFSHDFQINKLVNSSTQRISPNNLINIYVLAAQCSTEKNNIHIEIKIYFFISFINNHNYLLMDVCASWALHNFLSVGIRLECHPYFSFHIDVLLRDWVSLKAVWHCLMGGRRTTSSWQLCGV